MKALITFLIFLFILNLNAQWVKTNGPESGSITNLIKCPNGDLLAVVSLGGIYKSKDNGNSWVLSIKGLEISNEYYTNIKSAKLGKNNSLYVYALTSSGKERTFVSNDNGDSWQALPSQVWGGGITDALADGTIYQFPNREIAKSTDSGKSWTFLTTTGLSAFAIKYVLLLNNNDFFIVSDKVYKSTDAGITWKPLNIPGDLPLYAGPDGTLFYYVNGTIRKSTDKGETWVTTYTSGFSFSVLSMTFAGNNTIFAGKNSGVLKSTDNGNTWAEFSTGLEVTGLNNAIITSSSGDVLVGTADYGIFKSSSNLPSFTKSSKGLTAATIYDIYEASNGILYAVTSDAVYKSIDGGQNWESIIARSTLYMSFCATSNYLFLGKNDGVMRSGNGGATWTNVNSGLTIGSQQYIYDLEVTSAGTLLAGTGAGLFRSTNNGDSWTKITTFSNNKIYSLTIKPNGDIFVASNNFYYKSSDDGVTWSKVNLGQLINPSMNLDGQINVLDYLSDSKGNLYINFGSNKLLKSTDNGSTWELKSLPSGTNNMGIQKLIFANNDSLIIVTNGNVLLSTDYANTFTNFNSGTIASAFTGAFKTKTGNIFIKTFGSSIIKNTSTKTSIENITSALPKDFKLFQNYPNPFNPSTKISYSIPEAGFVQLKVYNSLGQEVATLVNEYKEAGNYNLQFSISNYQLSSGIYFYKLQVGDFVQTKKMILAK